jgi:PAS domain S-box-containing protein
VRADRRRSASEVPWITGVQLAPGGQGHLINISKVGALVRGDTRLAPGTSITIWFAGIPLQDPLTAGVVRCEVAAIGCDGKLFYQSGIAFGQELELDVSAGGPLGKPPGLLEQGGAEEHDWEARSRAAEARCRKLDERHAAERREWRRRHQLTEARHTQLLERHRSAQAELEKQIEEAKERQRLLEQYAAERVEWENAFRAAESDQRRLVEEHAAERARLEEEAQQAQARQELLDQQHQSERAEWDRTLQDAERRREAESADHRAECDRLGETLGEIRSRYRALVDHAPYPAYVCDADGKCLRANGALLQLLGHTSEADLGALTFLEDVDTSVDDGELMAATSRHPDEVPSVEVEWQRKDGVKLTVQLSRRRLSGDPEARDATEIIVNDVTRLRALECQARRYAALETTMVELTEATRGLQERLTAFLRGVDEVKPGEG